MKGRIDFTKEEAKEIEVLIALKLASDGNAQKGVRAKIRKLGFHALDFGLRGGYTVQDFRNVVTIKGKVPLAPSKPKKPTVQKKLKATPSKQRSSKTKHSDEAYVIDLCDQVIQQTAIRQHRFDFLKGDSGTKLPVDAYYPSLNLVVEYYERQHSESVPHFDKRMTVSGISRGEQRKLYDERRKIELPKNGVKLVVFDYTEFQHTSGKRLVRDTSNDLKVIRKRLNGFIRQD